MSKLVSMICLAAIFIGSAAAAPWNAKDLNPVSVKTTPNHAPIVLVSDGKALGSIIVMNKAAGAVELQSFIEKATGAKLPIVHDKITKISRLITWHSTSYRPMTKYEN